MKVCPTCNAQYGGGELFCPVDATRLSTPSQMEPAAEGEDPLVGTTLGDRYKIQRRMGEGGMGIVYEAQHVVIEKRVALKVLRDDFSSRPEVVERFRQEAKSASRIGHQHIVDISDFGETPRGASYFVMEYLEGEDLANVLGRESTVAPERAVDIAVQCCRALGAAHAKGIVHRDMKPENIFLVHSDDGRDFVKIVDFGIAKMSDIDKGGGEGRKLTKTGMIFGTPEYMSPEQGQGHELDHRVDIYAMGAILFEMLVGRVPFVGDSFMGILTQHMFQPPPSLREVNPNVQCSAELEAVVFKALAKKPDERYQTMDQLAHDLQVAMGWSKGETTASTTAPARTPHVNPHATTGEMPAQAGPSRGRRVGLIVGAAMLLLAGVGIGGWMAVRPGTTTADSAEATTVASAPDVVESESAESNGPSKSDDGTASKAADGTDGTAGTGASSSSSPQSGKDKTAGNKRDPGAKKAKSQADAGKKKADDEVEIRVETVPAGARLAVVGRGSVCEATPCTFRTPRGDSIRLRAVRGGRGALRSVDPNEDTTIKMRLRRVRRGGRDGRDRGGGGSGRSGDLKVPDIFR